jgi:15-cis-phytoene synthase
MTDELRQSYKNVQLVARRRARNFYYSFVLLPREKRRALCAVYAFMRHCDDIADGAHSEDRKRELLRRWREQLDGALRGDCDGDPILPAFRDAVRRFSIPGQYFHWILDGVEMDLAIRRYESFAELYRYCFNVAGAVGLTCLQIFGFRDEKAKDYAEQCGIAFQLTNILRDVSEDARMERIYIPIEELRRFGYSPEDLMKGVSDDRYFRLMTYQASRARGYYDGARNLLPLVDRASRPALWAMMEIYRRLLDKIVQARYAVFGRTVRVSNAEKCSIALRAMAMRFLT